MPGVAPTGGLPLAASGAATRAPPALAGARAAAVARHEARGAAAVGAHAGRKALETLGQEAARAWRRRCRAGRQRRRRQVHLRAGARPPARDRYRLYRAARRFALAGGVALCERYPVPQNYQLAGPRLEPFAARLSRHPVGRLLLALERNYYRHILAPDVLIVLQIDPELAVQRKTTEPAEYVRARAHIVGSADWSGSGARIVPAGRPLAEVIEDLKVLIWS